VASKNRIYKVTSLFIKTAILILSLLYIFNKLSEANEKSDLSAMFRASDLKLIVLAFFLLFINWGLEAIKWKVLIRPLEEITFMESLKAVFAGVTVSIFMPNRVGEFAGRIFFLNKAGKVEATLKNFVGSIAQLFMTLAAGILAFFLGDDINGSCVLPPQMLELRTAGLVLIILIILVLLTFLINRYRNRLPLKLRSWFSIFFDTERKVVVFVVLLSAVRYLVFLSQYYLVLIALGVEVEPAKAFELIAITFLITSIVPSFAFTEIATRGAAAVYLFAAYTSDTGLIIAASILVWIINLAIPALIGAIFIWKLKFFRQ
jgi:uncharacterized membrane protein YbhN (UPF0104 family)